MDKENKTKRSEGKTLKSPAEKPTKQPPNKNISKKEKALPTSLYEKSGKIHRTGEDLCDCLDITCPGCFFECTNCSATKCGIVCRNNRDWSYDEIENEGTGQTVKKPANYSKGLSKAKAQNG